MKKKGQPGFRELVVCKITSINPNSAYAKLIEYENLSGMIHVSEVARKWVRDIREFIKPNQFVVCTIMRIEGSYISLSIKRVSKEQSSRKMNEYKREIKATKMLEILAKTMDVEQEEVFDEVGYPLQEAFGSLSKAFEIAIKNEELFRKRGELKKEWADSILEMIKKNYSEKVYKVKSELNISTYNPDGIDVIKKILLKSKKAGFDVKYISAPKYTIQKSGKNFKNVHSDLEKESERIIKEIEKAGGEAFFEVENKAKK